MNRGTKILCRGMLVWSMAVLAPLPLHAGVTIRDDAGNEVRLSSPARRIVSLAPHITELLYASGAGGYIVGAVEYSDWPEAAKRLPRVGSGAGLDLERIISLQPDLVIGWQSGNPAWQTARLKQLGITVFITEPRRLEDVARLIGQFGMLANTQAAAVEAQRKFLRDLHELRARHAARPAVPVFYQILDHSLLTVNREHLISDVIELCGGRNVFGDLNSLVPRVDTEAVLAADPEAVVASGHEMLWPDWQDRWHRWESLSAVAKGNLFFISPDLIHRNSPRVILGARKMCLALEQARVGRKSPVRR